MRFRAAPPALLILALSGALSCSIAGPSEATADIVLSFGQGASRALETGWEGGTFPALSSITVTVSASDMRTVRRTVSGDQRTISVNVPLGKERLVEVTAVPAAIDMATAFSGSVLADISASRTTRLSIHVELSQSVILLPSYNLGYAGPPAIPVDTNLYMANSISSGISSSYLLNAVRSAHSDFEFDDRGRIYFADASGIERLASLSGGVPEYVPLAISPNGGIAYDSSSYRVYYTNISAVSTSTFRFADITLPTPVAVNVDLPPGFVESALGYPVAADSGYAYLVCNDASIPRIVKVSVGAASGAAAPVAEIDSARFADLGLVVPAYHVVNNSTTTTYMAVEDMLARDGILYVLASECNGYQNIFCYMGTPSLNYGYSKGKIIAINSSTMTKLWETGWPGDSSHYPSDPATQFYAPRRIIGIMPKKLFIADDGFWWDGVGHNSDYVFVNKDRVMEVDTAAHTVAVSGLNVSGTVGFFNDFSPVNVC